MIEPLKDHRLIIYPSDNFRAIIKKLNGKNIPRNIEEIQSDKEPSDISDIFCSGEEKLPKDLFDVIEGSDKACLKYCIRLKDLVWLKDALKRYRQIEPKCPRLSQLLAESKIVVPKNQVHTRNENLEERCVKLRNQQLNREYRQMTKNVDNTRVHLPEDTIAFQMKEMNRQLIAVFQFVVSVFAGFAFGFIGIELLVGSLDFGFRLLLGIIAALIIALAEIYFLAKKLAETDQQIDTAQPAPTEAKEPKETTKPHRD